MWTIHISIIFLWGRRYRKTWGYIEAIWRMLEDFLLKYFQQVKGLLGHMWPSVVLQQHYPSWELHNALAFGDLFMHQQNIAAPQINCITALYFELEESIIHQTKQHNFHNSGNRRRSCLLLLQTGKKTAPPIYKYLYPLWFNTALLK